MKYQDVIKHFGNHSAAARALGMTRQGLYLWRKRPIPYNAQLLVQERSGGKLRAKNGYTIEERIHRVKIKIPLESPAQERAK